MSDRALETWYAAIKSGDEAALRAAVTEDVVLYWNGDAGVLPWAGRHQGAAAVQQFFATLARHVEVVSITTVARNTTPDAAVITLDGQWRMRATGRIVEARAANIFRFRDGRIDAYEVYNDTGRFAAALNTAALNTAALNTAALGPVLPD